MKITVPKGKNFFRHNNIPFSWPFYPHFRSKVEYRFRLYPEWWTDNLVWTEPEKGFGCKMVTIGKAPSYHRGGANNALGRRDGNIIFYPRYYENRPMYTENKLHELSQYGIVVHEPMEWIYCTIITDPHLMWFTHYEGEDYSLMHEVQDMHVKNWWLHYPYLGRNGWDLNYAGYDLTHNKFARANQSYSMDVEFIK